jgi:hypothetical protein
MGYTLEAGRKSQADRGPGERRAPFLRFDYRLAGLSKIGLLVAVVPVTVMSPRAVIE